MRFERRSSHSPRWRTRRCQAGTFGLGRRRSLEHYALCGSDTSIVAPRVSRRRPCSTRALCAAVCSCKLHRDVDGSTHPRSRQVASHCLAAFLYDVGPPDWIWGHGVICMGGSHVSCPHRSRSTRPVHCFFPRATGHHGWRGHPHRSTNAEAFLRPVRGGGPSYHAQQALAS
jgi:hypothetical protein